MNITIDHFTVNTDGDYELEITADKMEFNFTVFECELVSWFDDEVDYPPTYEIEEIIHIGSGVIMMVVNNGIGNRKTYPIDIESNIEDLISKELICI